jgi:hypothetical protein
MYLTSNSLADIMEMTVRELRLTVTGTAYWRYRLQSGGLEG